MAKVPNLPMADTLIHGKVNDREEVIVFPITRYTNVVGCPDVVDPATIKQSAPFQLLRTDAVDIEIDSIRSMCGNII